MPSIPTAVADTIRKVFRKPAILAGEDPADYEDLKNLVLKQEKPRDLQMVLLVKDIIDAEWEIARMCGIKPAILHAVILRAIKSQITDGDDKVPFDPMLGPKIRKLVTDMVAGQVEAKQEFERMLEPSHLTLDIIIATAFKDTVAAQGYADRMVAAAIARRNAAYAELERIRNPVLRGQSKEIIMALAREMLDRESRQSSGNGGDERPSS
jgi:hypothetical protein